MTYASRAMDHAPARSSPKRRAKFLIGGAIVLSALIGLMGWAMGRPEATALYLHVRELQAMGATPAGKEYRVNGRVVAGSIERRGLQTRFDMGDGGQRLTVSTDEPLPDAFRNGSEVVARGTFDGELFSASQVLAKCPSKFKAA